MVFFAIRFSSVAVCSLRYSFFFLLPKRENIICNRMAKARTYIKADCMVFFLYHFSFWSEVNILVNLSVNIMRFIIDNMGFD